MRPNKNCLEGLRCPKCHSPEPMKIKGTALFTVYDSGTEEFQEAEFDLDDDATIICGACGHSGNTPEFKEENSGQDDGSVIRELDLSSGEGINYG